jgi:hypothetical protein
MQGSVDELRIYNGVFEPDDVRIDYALGPNQLPPSLVRLFATASEGTLTVSWSGNATGVTLQSRSSLTSGTWAAVTSPAPQLVNGMWQVSFPDSAKAQYFRLVH